MPVIRSSCSPGGPAIAWGAVSDNTIIVARDHTVFEGALGQLRPHTHGSLAILVGLEAPFEVTARGQVEHGRIAVIPASVRHGLDFHDRRVLVCYAEPHAPGYASLHRSAAGSCRVLPGLDRDLEAALRLWSDEGRLESVWRWAHDRLGDERATIDPRIAALTARFSEDELLDAPTEVLAEQVGLSTSRFIHLFTSELGAGVRRVKQYYRFKLAVRSVATGGSLTTAAHHAGFADSSHFSRAFLDTFGLSPASVLLRTEDYRLNRPAGPFD